MSNMGCAASKAVPPSPNPAESVPKPVAFEIPIEEEVNNKAKKLPPQILQRLEEQNQNNITVEGLQEKQQKAHQRRTSILEEKCRIARQAQKKFSKYEDNPDMEEKENRAS